MAELSTISFKTKKGLAFEIRSATGYDAEALLKYVRVIIEEDVFSLTTLDEFKMTVEQECNWLEVGRVHPAHINLLVICENQIVGFLNFSNGHRKRIAHTGDFGMSIASSHRGCGMGLALLQTLIAWAKAHPILEKITLNVHQENKTAQSLYEKCGFTVEGIRKKDLKYAENQYSDTVCMGLFV